MWPREAHSQGLRTLRSSLRCSAPGQLPGELKKPESSLEGLPMTAYPACECCVGVSHSWPRFRDVGGGGGLLKLSMGVCDMHEDGLP